MPAKRLRALISVLLVASAVLFAIGVFIERGSHHGSARATAGTSPLLFADADQTDTGPSISSPSSPTEPRNQTTDEGTARRNGETHTEKARETPAERSHETHGQASRETPAERAHERNSERVFGINTESIPLVIAAVATSLALAVAVWLTDSLLLLAAIAGLALVAAAFDVREMFHQIDEARTDLTIIATLVALLHLAITGAALALARTNASAHPTHGTQPGPLTATARH